MAPAPDFVADCSSVGYDNSATCTGAVLAAIANARRIGGMPAMVLPSNWYGLTAGEQLYVATNLERTARGLPPLSAMAGALDAAAAQAAQADRDPVPPTGFPWTKWGSNWAGGLGNPLEAIYFWMYDDGPGSANASCSVSNPGTCWQHRHNILLALACTPCVLGAALGPASGTTSLAEIVVDAQGSPAVDFTWAQEGAYLG